MSAIDYEHENLESERYLPGRFIEIPPGTPCALVMMLFEGEDGDEPFVVPLEDVKLDFSVHAEVLVPEDDNGWLYVSASTYWAMILSEGGVELSESVRRVHRSTAAVGLLRGEGKSKKLSVAAAECQQPLGWTKEVRLYVLREDIPEPVSVHLVYMPEPVL